MSTIAHTLDEALAPITDGCMLAVPRESSGAAMAATRALVRRGVKRLHLITLPTSSLQADLLIGAGCVETLDTSGVSLGEFGPAPRFSSAIVSGAVHVRDATCPALHAQFQAAEKGVPFMPLRGLIGSDVLAHRPDWKIFDNPFGSDDPIVLLPALKPDVVLFHAALADRTGNVFIGTQRELVAMAHAAQKTVVTVEKIHEGDLLRDPLLAAGTLPGFYVRLSLSSRADRGRCRCRIITASTPCILPNTRGLPRRPKVLPTICSDTSTSGAPPERFFPGCGAALSGAPLSGASQTLRSAD
jgi:glutaconate CoA-transferase, subunit A